MNKMEFGIASDSATNTSKIGKNRQNLWSVRLVWLLLLSAIAVLLYKLLQDDGGTFVTKVIDNILLGIQLVVLIIIASVLSPAAIRGGVLVPNAGGSVDSSDTGGLHGIRGILYSFRHTVIGFFTGW